VPVTPTAQAPADASSTPPPTGLPTVEARVVELEWPPAMRLGDSDVIRLAVIPAEDALVVTTEFEDHTTITQPVPITRLPGFDLAGVARLDAVGFASVPEGEQVQPLLPAQTATWRWTVRPLSAGQHRIAILLRLRWVPQPGNNRSVVEAAIYDRGLTIQVQSLLGLTTRELALVGVTGIVFGSTLSLPLAAHALRPRAVRRLLQVVAPNPAVVIEQPPGLHLTPVETDLLRALFNAYGRLVLAAEFRSGYSGARTFLAQPLRPDGRADAYTIAKLGERGAIQREFENYENFVKDTLPPVTARIQSPPVTVGPARRASDALTAPAFAALRYTFIGEAGQSPRSLRDALLAMPDPALLEKLFATFGPNWWMQRRPYTFRLAYEYDRLLPTHFVVEPASPDAQPIGTLDGRLAPGEVNFATGDVIRLQNLRPVELRPDGRSLSLSGAPPPGQPPLRVRWLSLAPPANAVGQVVATRAALLADSVSSFALGALPDPLTRLPALLSERVSGTQATIHGDLNLENVLVGPGGFVWLIDFAQTRDGHTLFDFAYLEAALIAQVIAPSMTFHPDGYAQLADGLHPLQSAVRATANRCLFNPDHPREYWLALCLACLGGLKFVNLDHTQKEHLYLTAAVLASRLNA
jgi:hypothetical protein